MRKIYFLLAMVMILGSTSLKAQTNIQEMYDFGRGHFTTTLEMFQKDNWGSTFFFTDIYHIDANFPTGYYTEIARSLNFWQNTAIKNLSLHVEWNGGQFANNAWLVGLDYFFHNRDFSNTLTFSVLYKNIRNSTLAEGEKANDVPLQLTAAWTMNDLFNFTGLTFTGYIDFWWQNNEWNVNDKTTCTLQAEPQIWYNVGQHFGCDNLNVGGEVEVAYNFAGACPEAWINRKGLNVAPCLGIKWVF